MGKIKKRKVADGHRLDIRPVRQDDGYSCGLEPCAASAAAMADVSIEPVRP